MRISIIEKEFNYRGFNCKVVFHQLGHRCGYLEIPRGHKLFEKDYYEIDLEVHGGLTYADHYSAPEGEVDEWWIGFDCAHSDDAKDYKTAFELFKDYPEALASLHYMEQTDRRFGMNEYGEIRTLEFVEDELKSLVVQILRDEMGVLE